jgi:transposase-like protein
MPRRKNGVVVTEEVKKEMVDLYLSQPNTTVREISQTYGVPVSAFYRLINTTSIPRRGAGWTKRILSHRTATVKLDQADFVQEVTPIVPTHRGEQWVVKYTAEVTVEAESIDQALAEVRKLGTARRIYSIRLK